MPKVKDPVCGMVIDSETAKARADVALRVRLEGGVEHGLALGHALLDHAMVHVSGRQESERAVMVVLVVPARSRDRRTAHATSSRRSRACAG